MNPDTAATDHELFRLMNAPDGDEFKREMLKGAMALQHGTISQANISNRQISRNITRRMKQRMRLPSVCKRCNGASYTM